MSRWTSFALMAATAVVAAPVGSLYVAQQKAPAATHAENSAVTQRDRAADKETSSRNKSGATADEDPDAALTEARHDLAGVVCAFAAQADAKDSKAACSSESVTDAQVMLAILPDPAHTHLALRFDRAVDSIEDQLRQMGWVYARSWLPWDNVERKSAERWHDRSVDSHLQQATEQLPGVLLFHEQNRGNRKRLIVLVVGDSPTGGVNANQFTQAVNYWRQPCRLVAGDCSHTAHTLAILGPTFSGSLWSLGKLLKENFSTLPCSTSSVAIRMSSGTVSDTDYLQHEIPEKLSDCVSIYRESFAVDGQYLAMHLDEYMGHHVAHVSEKETAFGDFFAAANERSVDRIQDQIDAYHSYLDTLDCQADAARCSEVDETVKRLRTLLKQAIKDRKNGNVDRFPELYFPRGISRLRHAYEENGIVGFATASNTPRTQLQLSLSDDSHGEDTVPSYAGSLNAVSMEGQMASLANTLVGEHISTVLLSASDVMDEIFVARYLAQHAPDVTVIINDTDELFLREAQDNALQNVYTVGSWPLLERNVFWSSAGKPTDAQVFASGSDQGTAAALHHLVCTALLSSENNACSPDGYREYRPPFITADASNDNKLEPPLWLSFAGHGGFVPIALLDLDDTARQLPELNELDLPRLQNVAHGTDGKEKPFTLPTRDIQERTSLELKIAAVLVIAFLLWHGAACVRSRLDRPFAWTYARAERTQDTLRMAVRGLITLLALFALMLLYIPQQVTVRGGSVIAFEASSFHFLVICGECLAALISATIVWLAVQIRTWHRMIGPQTKPPERLAEHVVELKRALRRAPLATSIAAAWFVFVLLGLAVQHWNIWWMFVPHGYSTEKVWFLYRASMPLAGASPLLPLMLMLAAGVIWVRGMFSELAFFGHRIPLLPGNAEDLRCPSNRWMSGLNDLLSNPRNGYRVFSLSACVLVSGLAICLPGRGDVKSAAHAFGFGLHSLAHGPFDLWMSLAALFFGALILYDLIIAMLAWNGLRHGCLIPLKQSPLRWGFTWIKGFSWKRIWTSTSNLSSNQVFDYLLRMMETNERQPTDRDVKSSFANVASHYASDPKDEEWLGSFTTQTHQLLHRVQHAAEHRLSELRRQWTSDAGPVTGTDEERGIHHLQKLAELKDESTAPYGAKSQRKQALQRMGSEEFVALLYVGYISAVLVQIRQRIMRAAMVYILLMWAVTCYPWMYRHTILLEVSALLITLAAATIFIYSQMHRDYILSRLTETASGKLDSDFFQKVIPIIGVPLLTLIASQFPEFSNLIFSWIQPGLSHMQ